MKQIFDTFYKLKNYTLSLFLPTSVLLFIFSVSITSIADGDKVFVQSKTTSLKKDPKMDSPVVINVNRGDELKIIKSEGMWLFVESNKNQGWISKILTSKTKPIGQADLLNDYGSSMSKEKSARKRTSEYAVSAATRGLAATERNRSSLNKARSNREALKNLDELSKTNNEEIEGFIKEGSLNEN